MAWLIALSILFQLVSTLVENGLVEYERIVDITSRLIVNPVSYRMKDARISEIVERIAAVLKEKSKMA